MARIRSIKPEFFRHEELQELGAEVMLVFAGIWTQCDNHGRFPWRPRQLKLDLLPFMDFDMEQVLNVLNRAGFVEKYFVDGKWYGCVPTFRDHQRLSGKELTDGNRYPDPPKRSNGEAEGKQRGSDKDQQESQEKEREREKEREKESIYCADFNLFWDAYPRKIGKDAAAKAWKKCNGSKPSIEIVLQSIELQKQSEQWQKEGGQFIPNPATWINQGRWGDELPTRHALKGQVSEKALNTLNALQGWRAPE